MRILHVDKFLYRKGGAPGYMLDLAELQRSAGHDVEFFAMKDTQRNLPSTYEAFFPSHVALDPPPRGIVKRALTLGRMIWSLESLQGIARTVDAFRPDVVHLHTIYHQLSPSILQPLARRKIPVVMTLHDYKLVCPTYARLDHGNPCDACLGGNYLEAVKRRCKNDSVIASGALAFESAVHRVFGLYSSISVFICPSHFMLDSMKSAKMFTNRLRHIPHFFDCKRLAARDGHGEGVVAAGRLSPEKGFDLLIDAIGEIPDAHLTIVGDGPLEAELRARAAVKAPGRITFTGRNDRGAVLQQLRAARVAVVPSRWYENQPLAIIEAMGSGVAPVVTTLGGSPELVEHNVDGWVVEPIAVALAEAIKVPLHDPVKAKAMGELARQRIEREFEPRLHLQRVFEAYRQAGASAFG
jgi:glycosyltransferase involved in cell wall biosynthesis